MIFVKILFFFNATITTVYYVYRVRYLVPRSIARGVQDCCVVADCNVARITVFWGFLLCKKMLFNKTTSFRDQKHPIHAISSQAMIKTKEKLLFNHTHVFFVTITF